MKTYTNTVKAHRTTMSRATLANVLALGRRVVTNLTGNELAKGGVCPDEYLASKLKGWLSEESAKRGMEV